MSSEDTEEKTAETSGTEKFMNELQALSKAFSVDKPLSRIIPRSGSWKSRPSDPKQKPNDAAAESSPRNSNGKEKKPSLWSWKRLKALATNSRTRRFNCCFSLQVHSIDGLPPFFDDYYLIVHWKRRDAELMTRPVLVYRGVAEFEEQLAYSCSVYGSRSGPDNWARYEAKHFLLYASVYTAPELDLGSHRVDLTRLLPITLDELEEEKGTGNWTTSFKLTGKGMGAKMNVSFGYDVVGNNGVKSSGKNVPEIFSIRESGDKTEKFMRLSAWGNEGVIRRTESLPSKLTISNQTPEDVKELYEILPIKKSQFSESVEVLYQKLDEEISNTVVNPPASNLITLQDSSEESLETEAGIKEFTIVDKGIEVVTKKEVKMENDPANGDRASGEVLALGVPHGKDALIHPSVEETVIQKDEQSMSIHKEEDNMCSNESIMKELETALSHASDLMKGLDSNWDEVDHNLDSNSHPRGVNSQEHEDEALHQEHTLDIFSSLRDGMKGKSFSMNDISSMDRDFSDMQYIDYSSFMSSSESEPESPRERLLREFEKDAFANGGLLNIDIENDPIDFVSNTAKCAPIPNDFHQPSVFEDLNEIPKIRINTCRIQSASKLEDMEAKALMQDWGLNEAAFQHSPPSNQSRCDIGVDTPPEDHQQLPSLADSLGPFLQTKNGGLLRSMNPALFRNAKSGGTLAVQVSRPVVVPAEMGPGVMDILQCLAAMGIEKLSMQANKLMPLEEITGKSIQEIAWEAAPSVEGPQRQGLWQHFCKTMPNERKRDKGTSSCQYDSDTNYVSLDELAPLAMEKIEALSIEGLKIQSGMSDQDAPSNIMTHTFTEIAAQKAKTLKSGSGGLIAIDGTGEFQLLDIKDSREDVEGLMALSLTLDEWMKLDSGELDDHDDALSCKPTSKLLAAHHASSIDLFQKGRGRGRRPGLLGNNLTFALMVQLHDPLRNYEPVGTRMLALIQVERVFLPPKHRIFMEVPQSESLDEEEDEPMAARKNTLDKTVEERTPQYKITEAHVAGLKTLSGKKLWGSKNQQKSGSCWLLANGMGKKYKHPLMKARPVVRTSSQPVSSTMTTTTVQQTPTGDLLWSITSRVFGAGDGWTDVNPHIRNPNIIIPNDTLRIC